MPIGADLSYPIRRKVIHLAGLKGPGWAKENFKGIKTSLGWPSKVYEVDEDGKYTHDPINSEVDTPDGAGRMRDFEGVIVIWKKTNKEAFALYGPVLSKWREVTADTHYGFSALGYPVQDISESSHVYPDTVGSKPGPAETGRFEFGGIRWDAKYGERFAYGRIWAKLQRIVLDGKGAEYELGGEKAMWAFGWPTSDPVGISGDLMGWKDVGELQYFQGGAIAIVSWSRENKPAKTLALLPPAVKAWENWNRELGPLGLPIFDARLFPDGSFEQYFQGGKVTWSFADSEDVAVDLKK